MTLTTDKLAGYPTSSWSVSRAHYHNQTAVSLLCVVLTVSSDSTTSSSTVSAKCHQCTCRYTLEPNSLTAKQLLNQQILACSAADAEKAPYGVKIGATSVRRDHGKAVAVSSCLLHVKTTQCNVLRPRSWVLRLSAHLLMLARKGQRTLLSTAGDSKGDTAFTACLNCLLMQAARLGVACLVLVNLCCMAAAATDAASSATALPGLAASNQRLAAIMQQAAQQRSAQQSSPPSLLAFLRGVLGAPVALLMPTASTVPVTSITPEPAVAEQQATAAAATMPEPVLTAAAAAATTTPEPAAASAGTSLSGSGLSDADIDLINRLFSPSDYTGPYKYNSGLPPLQQLLLMDSTAVNLSSDRLRQLAKLAEPVSWVARTFVVGGEALLKLRLSPDLQLVIRDVISNSIAQSAAVPASQVLTFAAANVTLSLGFKGVGFGSTNSQATADTNAGLAAVRDALSQLAGGFDTRHIAVSFAPLPVPGQGPAAAPAAGSTGRRMLANQQDAMKLVYAR
jgi:hypothetical protein